MVPYRDEDVIEALDLEDKQRVKIYPLPAVCPGILDSLPYAALEFPGDSCRDFVLCLRERKRLGLGGRRRSV